MSVKVMSWVWDNSTAPGIDRLVLLAVADSADDNGGNAWPSVASLARKAGVNVRTVQRSIRRLADSGALKIKENAGKNGVHVYRVVMKTPPAESHPDNLSPRQSDSGAESPRQNDAPAESRETPGTQSPEPSLNHPSETSLRSVSVARPSKSEIAEVFEEFWKIYPRRTGKRGAQVEFEKAVKRAPTHVIIEGAKRYRDDPNREDGFTKHPSTWLHQDCWDDDPLPARMHGAVAARSGSPQRTATDKATEWVAMAQNATQRAIQ